MRVAVLLLVAAAIVPLCAAQDADAAMSVESIGNGLWRTFGFEYALPYNTTSAASAGWVNTGGACDPSYGLTYSQTSDGASKTHPLQIMFTAAGQFAGVRATVYGSSWTSGVGPAAQPQLVKAGYWIPTPGAKDTWYMTVGSRPAEDLCSTTPSDSVMGTGLVINRGGVAYNIPLSAKAANAAGYRPGSCMKTMGQHWMLDLTLRNGNMSWVEGNMLPIVPMYYPPSIDGTIHAIFFATPVAQPGAALFGQGDWETPALTAGLMCENFCSRNCHWKTHFWSTMHIYFNSDWKDATCPSGSGIVDRSCPSD